MDPLLPPTLARLGPRELLVNELFLSIQGESTHAGRTCFFVRLTGCHLRCTWCDTAYAFTEGSKKTVAEVVAEVAAHGCLLVEITGGEPLLQDDVYPLMSELLARGMTVLLETGGHISVDHVPAGILKIVDVKCPSSGESARTDWSNLTALGPRDEVKFVIQDRADYEYARSVVGERRLEAACGAVLFSPVHGVLAPKDLAAWVLADRLMVRVQLQVHKYIWGAEARGV